MCTEVHIHANDQAVSILANRPLLVTQHSKLVLTLMMAFVLLSL